MAMPRPRSRMWPRARGSARACPISTSRPRKSCSRRWCSSVITSHFDAIREQMEKHRPLGRGLPQGPVPLLHPGAGRLQARLHRAAFDRGRAQASGTHHLLLRASGLARHRDHDPADRSRHRARRVQTDASCATIRSCCSRRCITAIFWRQLFERHHHLDTDGLLRTNVELLTDAIRAPGAIPSQVQGRAMKRKACSLSLGGSARSRRARLALFTFPRQ